MKDETRKLAILKESTPSTEQEPAIRDYSRFKDSKLFTEQGRCSFKNQCDAESTPYKEQFCGCYNEEQRLKTEQESQEELWEDVLIATDDPHRNYSDDSTIIRHLIRNFTITRKPTT